MALLLIWLIAQIMSTCFELYATWLLDANAADFMQSGYLDTRQCELIRDRSYELLGEIRPQAVSIVDGFGLSDYVRRAWRSQR